MIRHFALFLLLILSSFFMKAQNSYVYIEGIKGIPFNVKSDNKEVAKLGKGYCILTYNTPGEKTIDISFANTNFSTQRFILDVQANSSYGFRMGKTDENKFYLIDLVNEGKIIETNTPVNLALSTEKNIINFYIPKVGSSYTDSTTNENDVEAANEVKSVKKKHKAHIDEEVIEEKSSDGQLAETKIEEDSSKLKASEPKVSKRSKKKAKETVADVNKETEVKKETEFGVVEVISESKNKSKEESPVVEKVEAKPVITKVTKNNSCTKTASDEEIKSIIDKLSDKEDDEAKLLLIKKRIVSGCYTSKQIFEMAQHFDTQYGRYSLIRFVFPLTSDQANLSTLDSLFKYETYKVKLKKMIENP